MSRMICTWWLDIGQPWARSPHSIQVLFEIHMSSNFHPTPGIPTIKSTSSSIGYIPISSHPTQDQSRSRITNTGSKSASRTPTTATIMDSWSTLTILAFHHPSPHFEPSWPCCKLSLHIGNITVITGWINKGLVFTNPISAITNHHHDHYNNDQDQPSNSARPQTLNTSMNRNSNNNSRLGEVVNEPQASLFAMLKVDMMILNSGAIVIVTEPFHVVSLALGIHPMWPMWIPRAQLTRWTVILTIAPLLVVSCPLSTSPQTNSPGAQLQPPRVGRG